MRIASNLTENYYVRALKNFLSCEARENKLGMQNINERFDSKRGVKKAIQRRKPWFTGTSEDKDQTSTLVARKVDFSNRLTVVKQLAADYAKEPVVEKETKKQRKPDAGNKEFYKNMFSGRSKQGRKAQQTFKKVYADLGHPDERDGTELWSADGSHQDLHV